MARPARYVDPDAFTVVVGVAGIVGGLASAASLIRDFARPSLRTSQRQALEVLERIQPSLRELRHELDVMREAVGTGIEGDDVSRWLGRPVLLPLVSFRAYQRSSDRVMALLRQVLKATHRLERRLYSLPWISGPGLRSAVVVQDRIAELLRKRRAAPIDALEEMGAVVAMVDTMITAIRSEMGHS